MKDEGEVLNTILGERIGVKVLLIWQWCRQFGIVFALTCRPEVENLSGCQFVLRGKTFDNFDRVATSSIAATSILYTNRALSVWVGLSLLTTHAVADSVL